MLILRVLQLSREWMTVSGVQSCLCLIKGLHHPCLMLLFSDTIGQKMGYFYLFPPPPFFTEMIWSRSLSITLSPKPLSWLAQGEFFAALKWTCWGRVSWAVRKCEQPQKVDKLASGSSCKWQLESFSANCRDFYLAIWKWHSKNCSLGAGEEVLHYRKQGWIWLKRESVLLGVFCFIEVQIEKLAICELSMNQRSLEPFHI